MIDGKDLFNLPIENDVKTYDNIRKITIGKEDDFTTGRLLGYNYFKEHKLIAIDLRKQQTLDAEQKAMQQINFAGNLCRNHNRLIFFIIEEAKETILDFSQGTVKVL